MGKNRLSLIISLTVLTWVFGLFLFVVYENKHFYLSEFEPKKFEKEYLQSQWVVSFSKYPISDETLYAYSGYRYIQGINPILLNPEVPPLGKYLIGTSIQLFQNQNAISLFAALVSLVAVFLIIFLASNSLMSASFGVLLMMVSTSFTEQLRHTPQLDIIQLAFLLLFILFFILFKKKQRTYLLFVSGLFLGGFISVKFFLMYFGIINVVLVIYYIFEKKKNVRIQELALLNGTTLTVYILSYFRYFMLGGNLRSFLGVQKWIVLFYSGSHIDIFKMLGNYLSLIFFNTWTFWQDGFTRYSYKYWNLLWPVIFILGIFSSLQLLRQKKLIYRNLILLLVSFLSVYNIFLFVTPVYPRYLLLLFVPSNIMTALYFGKLIENKFMSFRT